MIVRKLAVLVLLASCRIGFDEVPADTAPPADAPPVQMGSDQPVGYGSGGSEVHPAAAWDGARFLVAWNDTRGRQADPSIAGNRISPSGQVAGAPALWAFNGFIVDDRPAIACQGTGRCALIVGNYGSSGALYGVMMTDGAPTSNTVLVNDNSHDPDVVAFGGDFTIAYTDSIVVQPQGVFRVRMDQTGALTTTPAALEQDNLAASFPRLAASSTGILATWTNQGQELRFSPIKADGTVAFPNGQMAGAVPIATPVVAGKPNGFLLVWTESSGMIRASHTTEQGAVAIPIDIAAGTTPAVAWDGSAFLIAFVDAAGAIELATVTDGVDRIDTITSPGSSEPAIASDGAGTSIVAYAQNGIRAVLLHR